MSTADLFSMFAAPPDDYRGKPFWSWNGRLDREELFRQIRVLKDMGMGGFFMHSRTGLVTEYLGDDWFDLINACADEAERLGMEAWLYDEDRWPSGTAGGMVTVDPRFRMRFLHMAETAAAEVAWSDDVVAVFTCRRDGLSIYDPRRAPTGQPVDAGEGRTTLVFRVVEFQPSSFYNGYTYVDTLNPEATKRFIELTHELYAARCGDRLGRSIKGIFTDEPHRGALLDGFGEPHADGQNVVPWTAALPATFSTRFGHDLLDRLPELFLRLNGRVVSQVKWQFVEILQQMFIDAYAKPLDSWCREHNMVLTGHYLHEDSLASQTAMCGSMMRAYEHMEAPGVDVLTEGNRNWWIVKQLSSAARQLGRKWLLSELYGCTGWQMPFEGHKAVGDWQTLFGINLRCHHLSWYTMEGEAKRDFPASIFDQSAWWREYAAVETYFARLGVASSAGEPVCELLVVNPIESVWSQVYPGWSHYLGAVSPEVQALEATYRDIFHWLSGAQIDFDYGDEEMLGRIASVERDADGRPVLRVGQARYRTILAGGMTTMRAGTLRLLSDFKEAGGLIVFAGEPPPYVDALPSDEGRVFATNCVRADLTRESLVSVLDAVAAPAVRAIGPNGDPAAELFCQLRRVGDDLALIALNVNRETWLRGLRIRVRGTWSAEEWSCLEGGRQTVRVTAIGGFTEFTASFAPGGERVFALSSRAAASAPPAPLVEVRRTPVPGPYSYHLSEPNVCVLDSAEYSIDDGDWRPAAEVLRIDQAVRKAVGLPARGGEMLQPWFVGRQVLEPLAAVGLRFGFDIEELPTGSVDLVIERSDRFTVALNGITVPLETPRERWVDNAFHRFALPTNALRAGANTIEIRCAYDANMGLEAIYLLGDFGVRLDGDRRVLVTLPAKLEAGDITPQGLPFYSGAVTYTCSGRFGRRTDDHLFIELPSFAGACALVGAGGEERMIAWRPYEAEVSHILPALGMLTVRVVLTRRNTFGPLHQLPAIQPGYGPGNFVTGGEHWSDAPVLLPAGLLAPPVLVVRERSQTRR